MDAYSIVITVLVLFLLFACCKIAVDKEKNRGRLLWTGKLKAGRYEVLAKSPDGNYAILKADDSRRIGLETYGTRMPEVGQTFYWEVTKLKGYERKLTPVDEMGFPISPE